MKKKNLNLHKKKIILVSLKYKTQLLVLKFGWEIK